LQYENIFNKIAKKKISKRKHFVKPQIVVRMAAIGFYNCAVVEKK